MVERVPQPDWIMILVQVDDHISCYRCARNGLLRRSKRDQMAVRQLHKIVVRSQNSDIAARASGGSQRRIQLRGGHLPDQRPG